MRVLWFANTPCSATDLISSNYHLGGWLKSLEEKLVKYSDIELSICFYWGAALNNFTHKRTTFYPIYRSSSKNKIQYHINKYFYQDNDYKEVKLLLNVIEEVKPDIIHIHGTENNFGLIQEYTKIPCVISIQGLLSPYQIKFFDGIPQNKVDIYEPLFVKLKTTPFSVSYKHLIIRAIREQKILSITRHIIGRTNWDKRIVNLMTNSANYYVGNEMLRSIFYEKEWTRNDSHNTVRIVTVMGGALYKGLETIVQVSKLLISMTNIDFIWTVVGVNDNEHASSIVKRWLRVDYSNININLVGSKNENDLVEILMNSDLFCQCSHIENSSNSLCEAMLIGMPIVATFAGGTDSMLENGKEGILVQTGDYFSIAGAIKTIIEDKENAIKYARNARIRARTRNNPITIVSDLIKTYNLILKNY